MDKLTFYAPIEKQDDEQRLVYGYASTEALDSQDEVVKKSALASALSDYMKFANVREMHQPSAVGKTKKAQLDNKGLYVAVKVVDDKAWEKVKEGVYTGFSIGGRVKEQIGNEITGLTLSEISLVDRPANPEAMIDVWKMAEPVETIAEEPKVEEKPSEVKEEPKEVEVELAEDLVVDGEKLAEAGDVVTVPAEEVTLPAGETEAPKETADKPTLKKGMYEVANLAGIIEQLHNLEECVEFEGAMEEDDRDENQSKALIDHIKGLSAILSEMVSNETEEMIAEKAQEEAVETPAVATEDMKMADTIDDLAKVEEKLNKAEMPSDEEVVAVLKKLDQPINDKTISILKDEFAGKILQRVKDNMSKVETVDMHTKEIEKIEAVVDKIDVTPTASVKIEKAEETDLAKVTAELQLLKEQMAKFQAMPLPIKAKASFVTVEKSFAGDTPQEDVRARLAKAEQEADVLSKQLARPHEVGLEKRAAELSTEIMRLRRQVNGSNNQ